MVVGYGVQRKSDLTGSVASVKADELKGLSTTDAAAALQGKASGVQILNGSVNRVKAHQSAFVVILQTQTTSVLC